LHDADRESWSRRPRLEYLLHALRWRVARDDRDRTGQEGANAGRRAGVGQNRDHQQIRVGVAELG
jgi:hypothetical protein